MSEIQMSGSVGFTERGFPLDWGLDGWTEEDKFQLVVTSPYNEGVAMLNYEQCSMLLAALVEHMKEAKDAKEEDSN